MRRAEAMRHGRQEGAAGGALPKRESSELRGLSWGQHRLMGRGGGWGMGSLLARDGSQRIARVQGVSVLRVKLLSSI